MDIRIYGPLTKTTAAVGYREAISILLGLLFNAALVAHVINLL